ncbi:hypothetical protein Bca52824_017751 [Brassica carinata]|uniref:Uncharacterized protein n=1 Tax=Brassica carinata TaxID=52824 RepID=A0A8X7VNT3_BRACI|nr:hypothetical protein Bca52824_017751 [Brassica carinata]
MSSKNLLRTTFLSSGIRRLFESRVDSSTASPDRKRLPLIVGPRKSRLSLFTRKQQKLLKKAREMSGTPDLSALLKGKLQLLKKSATAGSPTRLNEADASPKERSEPLEQAVDADPPAAEPAKKKSQKKSGKKSVPSKGKKDPKEGSHGEEIENEEASEERLRKKAKKKGAPKQARQSLASEPARCSTILLAGNADRVRGSPAKLLPGDVLARTKSPDGPQTLPIQSPGTPLVCNPDQCTELFRQIRGGPREMPPVDDLVFKYDYIEASLANRQADGSMNVLVEKYDTALKQTMTELGASVKLSWARLGVIERLRADQERVSKKTLEEKEALRVKFEGLEATLKADRAAKKELAREKAALERANAQLEKEKAELQAERDAVVQKLIEERQRLRDSRGQEDLADTAPSRKESDPPVAEETVEEGDFLARGNSPRGANLVKVVEVHDSSPDEEEESDDEEELPPPDLVQTGEPPQEQEKEEEVVSTDVLDPEASLPPAPVEDPSASKDLSA